MGTAISGIKLPSKVAYIGDEALRDCKSLNSVEILGTDSLTMGEKVFYNTPNMKNGTITCWKLLFLYPPLLVFTKCRGV